jgi:hypothetical protein
VVSLEKVVSYQVLRSLTGVCKTPESNMRLDDIGVPVASVQETTIRGLAVKTVEENEGLRPRISWTESPDIFYGSC